MDPHTFIVGASCQSLWIPMASIASIAWEPADPAASELLDPNAFNGFRASDSDGLIGFNGCDGF